MLDLLKELGLDDNTSVFFTGDNGGQDRFKSKNHSRGYFGPNVNPKTGVEFRGGKGNLYEGGLRIPYLARWPGKIRPEQVSDFLFYQVDVIATIAELTGAAAPPNDGLSIVPTLLGEDAAGRQQKPHTYLYWEFRDQTAVRMGHWKALRLKPDASWALYNLRQDVSETTDASSANAQVLSKMTAYAEAAHEPVRAGTYSDPKRVAHEKDRAAKWGTAGKLRRSKNK